MVAMCSVIEGLGVDEGSVSLRLSEIWLGRIKGGGRCLLWEEALGGRALSGVLSQAKNPYVSLQVEPALPPRAFF